MDSSIRNWQVNADQRARSYCNFTALPFRAAALRINASSNPLRLLEKDGGPGESRTPDQRFRKPLLYPSELQARE